MEKKTFPTRRSSTLLRRAAVFAVLMLAAQTALWAYTVTLKAGRGTGTEVVYDSEVKANMADDQSSAANGQFWKEGSDLWFKFPDCPGTFTTQGDDVFLGWTIDNEYGTALSPGTVMKISKDLTLYADWGTVEFVKYIDFAKLKYAVTNMSPREVSVIEIDEITDGDISIPASVEHDGEEYAVTRIGDGVCKDNNNITALTIPATVRSIGSQSFKGCGNLTTLTIPAAVRTIGSESFQSCENLTTLTFAEGSQLETIGKYSFSYCNNLRSVYSIPGSVKNPATAGVFRGCPLEIVTIVGHGNYSDLSFKYLFNALAVQVTLPANEADGAKWTTFYTTKCNFKADDATTVYKAELVGNTLLLHEVQDRIINKEHAVILKSTGNPVLTKTEYESSVTERYDLRGSSSELMTPAGAYVLYGGKEGLGFYPYSGEYMNDGKAYIVVSASSPVRGYVGMNEEPMVGTVGIQHNADTRQAEQEAAEGWFTLDGRALSGRPARPGIYIRSGRKAVIR